MVRGLVVLAGVTLLLSGCTGSPSAPASVITVIPIGKRPVAPELSGELLDGAAYRAADYAGDVVVVNFWGSWCAPCVAEADDLEVAYNATKDRRVTFIGVNVRDGRDAARRFAELRASYPSIFDPSSRVALGFAASVSPATVGTPTTVVVDRQNRIAATAYGPIVRGDLEPVVTTLAAESP